MLPLYLTDWAIFAGRIGSKRHFKDIETIPPCVRYVSLLTGFEDVYLLNERIFAAHITICLEGRFALDPKQEHS